MTRPAPGHPLLTRRSSGVLLHLTSLPGRHGSGDLGVAARHFVDSLGWPISLVLMGVAFIGVGALAMRIKRQM